MARLTAPGAMHASYRELAEAAGVSISTLQHYFGKRTDIVLAALEEARAGAEPYLAHMRTPAGAFADSIAEALAFLRAGLERFGLAALHAMGLAEGLRHGTIGPAFVDAVLEMSIDAVAARLAEHKRRGEMAAAADPRHAAIQLIAPLLLTVLHQNDLGGAARHAIDMDRFTAGHAAAFVRAHRA